MLRRLRLSTKLWLVVGVAFLALVVLGLGGWVTVDSIRIGSDRDRGLDTAQELVQDTTAPSQNLVEPFLLAHRLVEAEDPVTNAVLIGRLRDLERAYRRDHSEWRSRLEAGSDDSFASRDLNDSLLRRSYIPALRFWLVLDDEVIPAVNNHDDARAREMLLGPLSDAYQEHAAELENVSARALARRASQEAAAASSLRRHLWVLLGIAGAAALGLAGLAGLLVRSIRRPVLELTSAAHHMAQEELPRTVAAIERGQEGAAAELTPITVRSGDELADLARALNTVRRTAVDLAVGQADLRRASEAMVVHLGRRNQALVARQLAAIDRLERTERDPDVLASLFEVDHLATRMRRQADSLLILAGEESPRRSGTPVDLQEVVRGALSEVEEFERVEVSAMVPRGVAGHVASDLAHLLAELVDNAVNFSPPSCQVTIEGGVTDLGLDLLVIDRGLGMDAGSMAEANQQLTAGGHLSPHSTERLGLDVVARLASRHRMIVRLEPTSPQGVTARVRLPAALLTKAAPIPVPASPLPIRPGPHGGDGSRAGSGTVVSVGGASPPGTDDPGALRSPEDVRAMLTRFRVGVDRGRAAAEPADRPAMTAVAADGKDRT